MWAKTVAFAAGAAVGFGAVLVGRAVLARYEQEGGLPTPFKNKIRKTGKKPEKNEEGKK